MHPHTINTSYTTHVSFITQLFIFTNISNAIYIFIKIPSFIQTSPSHHQTPFLSSFFLYSYLHPLFLYMKMKMRGRATILLFMLFFSLFSSLPSTTTAVPSSRSLKSLTGHLYHEIYQVKKGRIDVELTDYSGTGANNHHDPSSPPGSF